jgi:2-dehydro-3-deoxygluconokinase
MLETRWIRLIATQHSSRYGLREFCEILTGHDGDFAAMQTRILCFGELLLRLGAPGRELLLQSPRLDVHVGGAEANVAVGLAHLGRDTAMVSVLPDNALGDAALGELRRHGVDTRAIQRGAGRMGLYFLSCGAIHRPSDVLYDRAGSAFAIAPRALIDWTPLLVGAGWLHLSGITPALGVESAAAALRAARAARAAGVRVSFDGNYRAKLWEAWSGDARGILRELMAEADIVFGDYRDIGIVLGGTAAHDDPRERHAAAARAAFAAFPKLTRLAATDRVQRNVDHHDIGALMAVRNGETVDVVTAATQTVMPIVDRIGAGDAFAAGLLNALIDARADVDALCEGLAAACLKHAIPGDFPRITTSDIAAFVGERRFDVRR